MASSRLRAYLLVGILSAIQWIGGCGGGEKEVIPKQAQSPPLTTQGVYGQKALTPSSGGSLSVRLIPERPVSERDLEAVLLGSPPSVVWRWEKGGDIIPEAQSSRLSMQHFSRGDEITVIAQAGDHEVRASAVIINSPPKIKSLSFAPVMIYRGVDITAKPVVSDADGDDVRFRYQWLINGEELPAADSQVLRGGQFKRGDSVSLKATPFDGRDEGESFVTRSMKIPNGPPRFVSTPPVSFQGHDYVYQAAAEDADGDELSYSLVSAPHGMAIDSRSGKIEWKLSKDSAGTHTVEIAARDPEGLQALQKFTITITIPAAEKSE